MPGVSTASSPLAIAGHFMRRRALVKRGIAPERILSLRQISALSALEGDAVVLPSATSADRGWSSLEPTTTQELPMSDEIIIFGVLASIVFHELTQISPGGIIVPGYIALLLDEPIRVAVTIGLSLLTWGASACSPSTSSCSAGAASRCSSSSASCCATPPG